MTLYADRVVLIRYRRGVTIGAEAAITHQSEVQQFVGEGSYAAVVDVRELGFASADGRAALREHTGANRIATALVVPRGPIEYVGRRFFEEDGYELESAAFPQPEEAIDWARERMTLHG